MIDFEGEKAFDTKEIAEFTSKSVQIVRRMIREGKLSAYKIGKQYYVTEPEFRRVFLGSERRS